MAPKSTGPWHPTSFHSQNHPQLHPNPHHLTFIPGLPNFNPSFHSFHPNPPPPFFLGPQALPQSTSNLFPSEPAYSRAPHHPLPSKPERASTPEQDRPPGYYRRHTERKDGREYIGAAGFGHADCVERHTHPRDCQCGCRGWGRVTQTVLGGRLHESLPVPGVDGRTGRVAAASHPLFPNPAYPYDVAPHQLNVPVSAPPPAPAPIRVSFPPRSSAHALAPAPIPSITRLAPTIPHVVPTHGYGNAGSHPHIPGGWYGPYTAPMEDRSHVHFTPPSPPPPATTQGARGRWAWMPDPATAQMHVAHTRHPSSGYATAGTTSIPEPDPEPVIFSPPPRPSGPMPLSPITNDPVRPHTPAPTSASSSSSSSMLSTPLDEHPEPPYGMYGSAPRWHDMGEDGPRLRFSPRRDNGMDYPVVPPPSHLDEEPPMPHQSPTGSATSWGSARSGMPMPRGGEYSGMGGSDSDGDGIRVVGIIDHGREQGQEDEDEDVERCMRAEKRLERRKRELRRLLEDPAMGEYDRQVARERVERAEDEVTGAWSRRAERRRV